MCGEVELLPSFHSESAAPGAAPLLYVLQDKHYRINYSSTRCVRLTRCNDFHPRKGGEKNKTLDSYYCSIQHLSEGDRKMVSGQQFRTLFGERIIKHRLYSNWQSKQ